MELNDAALDDWKCPICLELLYKPCVNTCGHVFCFWCMHRAMDPFTPSQCPLCRAEYAHFPQVCEQLHFFLQKAFPAQHKQREADTREEETTSGIYSLEFQQQSDKQDSPSDLLSASGWSKQRFPCSACSELLYNPVVLNCGHAVCHATCRPLAPSQSDDPVCPRCDAPTVGHPAICTQWQDQLLQLLPEDMRTRGIASSAANTSPSKMPSPGAEQATSRQSAAAAAASSVQQPATGSNTEDTDANATARLRRRLLHAIRQDFSHHGVGCDACGLFPIKGRRYTCTDCPDKVGFDLCGKCHDKELHITGRFNQQHTPDHHMQLVRPMPTLFHIVQAANPELSMAQIRQLTGLAFDRHEEGVVGQALAQPHQNGPNNPGPGIPLLNPDDESLAIQHQPAAARRRTGNVAEASQPRTFHMNNTETHGRAVSEARAGAEGSAGAEGRSDADRDEATTWANAFIAEAQHAADAAEALTQARRPPAPAPEPLSAPAATGPRTSAFRRWFGTTSAPRSQDHLDPVYGIHPDSAMPGPPPQTPPPLQASSPLPVRNAATGSNRGEPQTHSRSQQELASRPVRGAATSRSTGRSQTHSRSQHDPTGQNWRWNLAGAAGGPTPSTTRPPASRPPGHDPTGQNWSWNLTPWQTPSAGNSRTGSATSSLTASEVGATREESRMTPRRARDSSGDVSAVPRPWRRRRLQADSPAVPADQSQSSLQSQDSGSRSASSGSWRRLLPSFLGNIWPSDARQQHLSATTEQQQHPNADPHQPSSSQHASAPDIQQAVQPQQQQPWSDPEAQLAADLLLLSSDRTHEGGLHNVQHPQGAVTQTRHIALESTPALEQPEAVSHAEEQRQASPPLPPVPNVWDDVALEEAEIPSPIGDAEAMQEDNNSMTDSGGIPSLMPYDADYAQGGDDPDREYDAMMLIMHAMQARSQAPERQRSAQGTDIWNVVPDVESASRRTSETENAEQYWRELEAADEAAFLSQRDGQNSVSEAPLED